MAVEAARDALIGRDRASIAALRFASTTFPFLDRLHSGIVAGALSLDDGVSPSTSPPPSGPAPRR
jgi:3-hydroxy-3-methylglutaryl CoA synthase